MDETIRKGCGESFCNPMADGGMGMAVHKNCEGADNACNRLDRAASHSRAHGLTAALLLVFVLLSH